MPAVRILVCASEAPRAPLNGSRLVLHELSAARARAHEMTVLALRQPGPGRARRRTGVELLELPLSDAAAARARGRCAAPRWRFNEPVEARRLAAPFNRALPTLLAERRFDVAHVMLGSLAAAPALGGVPAVIAPLDAWHLQRARRGGARAAASERWWRRAQERAVRRWEATRVPAVRARGAGDARRTRARWRALDPSLHVVTIPNGVDADALRAARRAARRGMLFTGALDAPSNEQAALRLAERIMPLRAARDPGRGADARRPQPRAARCARSTRRRRRRPRPAPVPVGRRRLRVPDGERHRDQEQAAGGDGRGRAGGRDAARLPGHRRPPRASSPTATPSSPPALVALLRDPDAPGSGPTPRARTCAPTTTGTPSPPRTRASIERHRCLSRELDLETRQRAVGRQRRALDAAEPACCRRRSCSSLSIIVARYLGPTEMGRQSYIAFVVDGARAGRDRGLPGRAEALRRRAARRPPRRPGAVALPLHAAGRAASRRRSACSRAGERRAARGRRRARRGCWPA